MPIASPRLGSSTEQPRTTGRQRWRVALACVLACAGLFALDGLFFRTPFYPSILEPDSSTGLFELVLWREQKAQSWIGDHAVVALGDSRLGFVPRLSNQLESKTGYIFRSAGVAGTDARSWYYMLRDLDPTRRRYRAIVLAVNDYDDEDQWFEPDDDIRALHFAIARLRFSDVFEFARSFHSRELQWEALRGSLLKGLVYQADFRAFLSNARARIRNVRSEHGGFERWTYEYMPPSQNMVGLRIDWSTLTATYPAGADDNQRSTVKGFLLTPPKDQDGRFAAFRRTWFGRIIDLYRGSPTKIIFVRLARGPIPRPDNLVQKKSATIRELASRPNVVLADEHAFDSLEHPEFFKDAMHLNRDGAVRFSAMLAEEVGRVLGPPDSPGGSTGQ